MQKNAERFNWKDDIFDDLWSSLVYPLLKRPIDDVINIWNRVFKWSMRAPLICIQNRVQHSVFNIPISHRNYLLNNSQKSEKVILSTTYM